MVSFIPYMRNDGRSEGYQIQYFVMRQQMSIKSANKQEQGECNAPKVAEEDLQARKVRSRSAEAVDI